MGTLYLRTVLASAVALVLSLAASGDVRSDPAAFDAPIVFGQSDVLNGPATVSLLPVDLIIVPAAGTGDYRLTTFGADVASIPWETALVFGSTIALGFGDWDWGSSSFGFQSEGFFGKNTKNGGMDKLGHAYSAHILTDFFTGHMRSAGGNYHHSALSGAILAMGVQTMVEVFDGFSDSHGFSHEDMIMNAAGTAFAYFRNTIPGMRQKVDFRFEYVPSGNRGSFEPHSDYSGQKYLLAFKLAGFEAFEDTPLRFLELHAGYFGRGFTLKEQRRGKSRSRIPYFAVGLNLQELFFGREQAGEPVVKAHGRRFFEYVQVPYTYATFESRAYDY